MPAGVANTGLIHYNIFGEIYAHAVAVALTSASQNDWDQILAFNVDGEANGSTPDEANSHIAIVTPGTYLINMNWSGYGPAQAHDWDIHVAKNNGTHIPNISAHLTNPSTQKSVSVSAAGIVSLALNDTIEMWVQRTSAGSNIILTTVHCNIVLTQIGGS